MRTSYIKAPLSIQKSRKVSDPADHEQPVCKRGKTSWPTSTSNFNLLTNFNCAETKMGSCSLSRNFNGFESKMGAHSLLSLPSPEDVVLGSSSSSGKLRRHAEFCANCYSDKRKGALVRCRDCRRSGKRTVVLYSVTLVVWHKVLLT